MDTSNFVVPSPKILAFKDEQPSSAQKAPLETCHENVSMSKSTESDMNDTDNNSPTRKQVVPIHLKGAKEIMDIYWWNLRMGLKVGK